MTSPAGHEMTEASARRILLLLEGAGVAATLSGGWSVDALVGRQTRAHRDLDLWVPAADVDELVAVFVASGLDRLHPTADARPWNFVLHDGGPNRVDLHLYEPIDDTTFHYGAFLDGYQFPLEALGGRGTIGGLAVRCEAPEWAVRWHCGYPLRPVDRHDVRLLCDHFGLELPDEHR